MNTIRVKKQTIVFTTDAFLTSGVLSLNKQYIDVLQKHTYATVIIGREGNITNPRTYFPHTMIEIIPGEIRTSFIGRVLDGVLYARRVRSILQHHEVHAIHMSTPWSSLYTLLVPETWRIKKIITFHGAFDLELKSARNTTRLSNRLGDVLRFVIQWLSLSASQTIICCSQYSKKLLATHYKIDSTRNRPVIIIPGYTKTYPAAPRSKTDSQLHILYIGRIEKRKGVESLLRACAILQKRGVSFTLSIAAPADTIKNTDILHVYEELNLFTNVHIYHNADESQKNSLFRNADVFVMPSIDLETFGLTIIESLSRGVPVIGTPIGAIPEILSLVDKRLITKGVTATDIAKTLMWYQSLSIEQRNQLKKKSLDCILNHFLEERVEQKILSTYSI